jgi:hypothetical protein
VADGGSTGLVATRVWPGHPYPAAEFSQAERHLRRQGKVASK